MVNKDRAEYLGLVRLVAEQAAEFLREDEIKKILEDPKTFQWYLGHAIYEYGSGRLYLDEDKKSRDFSYGYREGYKLKTVRKQIEILRQFFPRINYAYERKLLKRPLPRGAEGLFVIPRWETIGQSYGEAVEAALDALREQRRELRVIYEEDSKRLRRHPRTLLRMQDLVKEQEGRDILLVPAQFGRRHEARSVRRVFAITPRSEFGLGSFEVIVILLTHPKRLMREHDIHIYCAGDFYYEEDSDRSHPSWQCEPYSRVPFFYYKDEFLYFDYVPNDYVDFLCQSGTATGFLFEEGTSMLLSGS